MYSIWKTSKKTINFVSVHCINIQWVVHFHHQQQLQLIFQLRALCMPAISIGFYMFFLFIRSFVLSIWNRKKMKNYTYTCAHSFNLELLLLLLMKFVFFYFISFSWKVNFKSLFELGIHIVCTAYCDSFLCRCCCYCYFVSRLPNALYNVHNNMQWQWQHRRQQAIATTFHCKTYFISLFLSFATILVVLTFRYSDTHIWIKISLFAFEKRKENKNFMHKCSCIEYMCIKRKDIRTMGIGIEPHS